MENKEKFKILFEKHFTQVAEKRKKIHSTTEKIVGLLLFICGWLITAKIELEFIPKFVLTAIVIVVSMTAMYIIYRDNLIYKEHARIVRQMSESLGVFEKDGIIKGVKLYPKSWKNYGKEPWLHGVIHHYLIVISIASLTLTLLFALC